MANYLQVVGQQVIGMPEGHVLLFLAKTDSAGRRGFCAVFGPAVSCIPGSEHSHAELFGGTVALFGKAGILDKTYAITHGHKYGEGGGFADIDRFDSWKSVAWQKAGSSDPGIQTHFMGSGIRPEDIRFAL